ncbi:helicase-associated domain-containing protein [Leucobacter triazinivorans]|uniref:Helicase XPB/Ssl2 N-terminal domain-containing protein n=1 Tax=Leucobacter triazinivorans TaxID=1784719 RepID=A0A4P6KGM8_9MICO|nr:helicase-associated domain-containing protein [Leucobacter triazinivorans]QBE49492.1 hypothetical protein EVS81_12145 [Leucobacter triazinivorans]
MSGTLALASAIAEMDRDALESLVRRRRPQAPAGVLDPIGLAAELLRPDSILRALSPLDRDALAVLLGLAEEPRAGLARDTDTRTAERVSALLALGLLGVEDARPVALPEVTNALRHALMTAGHRPDDLSTPPPSRSGDNASAPPAAPPSADSWVTAALTAVGQTAECLRVLRDRPARLNRSGSVAVASVRGMAESIGIEADHAAQALAAADRAGLVASGGSSLVVSERAEEWTESDHIARWLDLAATTLATIPAPLRAGLVREEPLAAIAAGLPERFPLLSEAESTAARRFVVAAEYLGLSSHGRLSSVAELLHSGERAAAERLVRDLLPPAAPGVYVQPDLSVIVPGPLAPADEIDLAALTVPEHIGVASTRRVTEASIAEAFSRGITPHQARAAFARVSLTGIPQPLDYLIGSLAERVGNIQVSEHHGDDGRTRIVVGSSELADTLTVDRALQHLQLHRVDPTTLCSRLRADHVLAALADARYHASSPRARASAKAATESTAPPRAQDAHDDLPEALSDLVERVFLAARSEPGTSNFTRRLELAIRDRVPVRVTAEARGQQHTFLLLPVSLSGGRLRATDQAAGVERTLPVNLITAVESA